MAEFNQYNLYSYAAGQMQNATEGKIFVDLQRFKSIHKMDELNDYIDKTFGDFDDEKIFEYPNGVAVYIIKSEADVTVLAAQDGKQIYGNRWYIEKKEP